MGLSLLLALLVTAPRAPADAEVAMYVPRLDAVGTVMPFFTRAGARSAILRPSSWREEAHPLLKVDVTSAQSLAAAGLDATKSLTVARRGPFSISCYAVADAKVHAAQSDERLARLGEVKAQTVGGVAVKSAVDPLGRALAAYAVKGAEACALTGYGQTVEKELPGLAKLLGANAAALPGFKTAAELPGAAYLVKPDGPARGAVGLLGDGLTLKLEAKARGLPLGTLAGPGPSPFAGLAPGGLLTLRLRVEKAQLPLVIDELARRVPGGAALSGPARQLAPALTGNLALVVHQVKVQGTLRTAEARFFAVKLALLAETTDPAAAQAAVDGLGGALQLERGKLEAGVQGHVVWLANDAAAKDAALAAVPEKPGKQAHAGEVVVDPALLARALGQVPLLEAVQSPELAGLVAASAELGPLLLASEKVHGWLDPAGPLTQRAQLTWVLKAPADAGR